MDDIATCPLKSPKVLIIDSLGSYWQGEQHTGRLDYEAARRFYSSSTQFGEFFDPEPEPIIAIGDSFFHKEKNHKVLVTGIQVENRRDGKHKAKLSPMKFIFFRADWFFQPQKLPEPEFLSKYKRG